MISDTISIVYKRCKIEVENDLFTRYKVYDIDSGNLIMEGSMSVGSSQAVKRLKERVSEYRAEQ